MTNWLYQYPTLYPGVLLRRYKRFFADIELNTGKIITAHCPNTGPMTGISTPGCPVQVSLSQSPTRKLPYTWEMIQVGNNTSVTASNSNDQVTTRLNRSWVGVNTALPNRVIKLALAQKLLPLGSYDQVRVEVAYGQEKSRADFLLIEKGIPLVYLEVKSTTWAQGDLVLFPDTVTTRGQKHIRELMAMLPQTRAVMLYFINRGDCTHFAPGDSADPTYGQLLRDAVAAGLEVLPCRFELSPKGIHYLGLAHLKL